jgi:predicted nucleic acid-binding Zn ribbon protein
MERLGDEVRRSLRSAGVPDAGVLAAVTRSWPAAVGPGIAAAAWPARIARDGTLHVYTVSSTWAFELDRLSGEIRDRLTTAMAPTPPPERFRFAVGPVPAAAAPTLAARRASPAITAGEAAQAATLAADATDPDLRATVERAVAASFAARRRDRPF